MTRRGPRVPDPEKFCLTCGALLVRKRFGKDKLESKDKFDARMYCDQTCYHLPTMRRLLECQHCGNVFQEIQGHVNKYCSRNCANEGQKAQPTDNEYTSRQRARQLKEEGPCEYCGAINNVETHHKDGDCFNNMLSNLVNICRSCHTKLHRRNILY